MLAEAKNGGDEGRGNWTNGGGTAAEGRGGDLKGKGLPPLLPHSLHSHNGTKRLNFPHIGDHNIQI